MKNEFKVRPVSTYSGARYPSTWYKSPPDEEEQTKHHPLHILLALVLVMGLAIGVIGCFAEYKSDPCALGLLPKNPNGSCDPPDPDDECIGGLNWCDNLILYTCKDDGSGWTNLDCNAYCEETLGFGGYAVGCDIQEDVPCQCEYDIIAGEMTECTPGDIVCKDEITLATCDQHGMTWNEQNCHDFCTATHGHNYYSRGCDMQAEEPCQCEYDIIEGDMPACTPGDIQCVDESTMATCDENGWDWVTKNCEEYCNETYGIDAYSLGCDAQAEEPCQCETDIMDGIAPSCSPGELWCADTDTVIVCDDDGWNWSEVDCNTWCTDTFGEDYYATECDDTDPDNICGCEYGIVDGGIGNPGP
jgi:hypothetical protein